MRDCKKAEENEVACNAIYFNILNILPPSSTHSLKHLSFLSPSRFIHVSSVSGLDGGRCKTFESSVHLPKRWLLRVNSLNSSNESWPSPSTGFMSYNLNLHIFIYARTRTRRHAHTRRLSIHKEENLNPMRRSVPLKRLVR